MKRYRKPTLRKHPHFLREWRLAAGLTLEEMSARMGISLSSLGRIEKGETQYYRDVVEMYAEVLGVEVAALLAGPPDAGFATLLRHWARMTAEQRDRALAHVEIVAGQDDTGPQTFFGAGATLSPPPEDQAPEQAPASKPRRGRARRRRGTALNPVAAALVAATMFALSSPYCLHLLLLKSCHGVLG